VSTELHNGFRARGAEVTSVSVYQWALPEDLNPLRKAADMLHSGEVDATLFTTSTQIVHLMRIASDMGIEQSVAEGLRKSVLASIGPTMTETLQEHGFVPDLEPTHPKLGLLVKETAEQAAGILQRKRN
jgi:uroporphyrinogen-III synthase